MDSPAFDFKAQARALLKTLSNSPAHALNSGLAAAAVEAALREAYAQGERARRSTAPSPAGAASGARPFAASPRASSAPASRAAPGPVAPAPECPHEWEETFLDGRALGFKCVECGVLQRDVQDRCDHYFVDTGADEVCVACRKPKRAKRA